MKKWILAASLGFTFASPAEASDWWWLGTYGSQPTRANLYVDKASIKKVGRHAFNVAVRYVNEKAFNTGEITSLTLERIECKARTAATLQRTSWNQQGKVIADSRWEGIAPTQINQNTAGEAELHFVCRDQAVPAYSISEPISHSLGLFELNAKMEAAKVESQAPAPEPPIGSGTGFFIDASGQLVTSYHVVKGAQRIIVYTNDGTAHDAQLVRFSRATDLAILSIDYRPSRYLTLAAANSSHPGDRVFTFGFPVLEMLGWEPKFTEGAISSLSGMGDEASYAQISVPVQPGNSGGPLVNEHGEVVGVIASGAKLNDFFEKAGTLPQNVNWAVRSEYIAPLIKSAAPAPVHTREEAIAKARASVVLVFVQFEPEINAGGDQAHAGAE